MSLAKGFFNVENLKPDKTGLYLGSSLRNAIFGYLYSVRLCPTYGLADPPQKWWLKEVVMKGAECAE